jgi:hypothetical protein
MRKMLWRNGVTDVHYESDDQAPQWQGMFFDGIVFDQPAYVTVLFEQNRARVIFADIYLRSHAAPPFWTVSECRSRFAKMVDGLQGSFKGVTPAITSTDKIEFRNWSAPGRYAETRLDIASTNECASLTMRLFDGTETELDELAAELTKDRWP